MKRIRLPSFANSANLIVQEEPEEPTLPKNIRALELLHIVVRSEQRRNRCEPPSRRCRLRTRV
jgi:hypothetical protein